MTEELVTGWQIYWITRLDALWNLGMSLAVFGSLLAGVISFLAHMEDDFSEHRSKPMWRCARRTLWLPAVGLPLSLFCPTTKEAAAMIVIPRLANSESVQGLGEELVGAANTWLKDLNKEDDK